ARPSSRPVGGTTACIAAGTGAPAPPPTPSAWRGRCGSGTRGSRGVPSALPACSSGLYRPPPSSATVHRGFTCYPADVRSGRHPQSRPPPRAPLRAVRGAGMHAALGPAARLAGISGAAGRPRPGRSATAVRNSLPSSGGGLRRRNLTPAAPRGNLRRAEGHPARGHGRCTRHRQRRPLRWRPRRGRRTMPRARQHPDRAARRPAPRDAATSPADTASRLPQYVFPFIVLSLVALTVLPAVLQRETRELRNEITDTLDPARFFVTEIQYALARQMAALRAFVITADGRSLDLYLAFLAEEAHARRDLAPLVARLGPGIQRGFADLVRNADAWHGRI